jgi:hypothetical protein
MEISHLGFIPLTFKFEISLSIAENSGSSNRGAVENQPPGVISGERQSYCLYFGLTIGISRKATKPLSFPQPFLRLGVFA